MQSLPLLTNRSLLADELKTLGELIRGERKLLGRSLVDLSAIVGVSTSVLARVERGKAIRTDSLFKVLHGVGLAMQVRAKAGARVALDASGQSADWHEVTRGPAPATEPAPRDELVMDQTTPTLFLSFDGTLHVGHGISDEDGKISLDTGRALFEFAPLLIELLRPYPRVEIVLTTGWLQRLPLDEVISSLPPELARRVVDTTKNRRPRFGYEKNGEGRTDVILSYVYGKRLKNWLAIDDAVFSVHKFGYRHGEFAEHFLLLDSQLGIGDVSAQERIRGWLMLVHQAEQSIPNADEQSVRDVAECELPIFAASELRITPPPRTPNDVRRLMAEGRFAEMTPNLAGYDDDEK